MPRDTSRVRVNGRTLTVSNLEKVLYPASGTTKGEVLAYYLHIAPVLLPHLHDRPVTLKRYPDGVEASSFFEKACAGFRPEWVETVEVPSEHKGVIRFCMINNTETLLWVANLAALELHPQLALGPSIDTPTALVFDLDPGAPASLLDCCRVALWLRDLLLDFGLRCYPKTSGGKGLHLYVPLNTPVSYQETKGFAHAVARLLERQDPEQATSNMSKEQRAGKVFIDWSQNDHVKTTVTVYSLRALAHPTVSTPLSWQEVQSASEQQDASGLVFEYPQVLARVEDLGDLFAEVLTRKQKLPPDEQKIQRLAA